MGLRSSRQRVMKFGARRACPPAPQPVAYVSIDLAVELEQLAFLVSHRERELAKKMPQAPEPS
jgi:hypothetical protein